MQIIFSVLYSFIMLIHQYKNKVEYVAGHLRKLIDTGTLPPGSRLKTAADLAKELNVSQMTADRAIRLLTSEGKLKRVTGKGTFVLASDRQLNIVIVDNRNTHSVYERDHLYSRNTYPLIEDELNNCNASFRYVKDWQAVPDLNPDGVLFSHLPPPEINLLIPMAMVRNYAMADGPYIQCVPDLTRAMQHICSTLKQKNPHKIYVFSNPNDQIKFFARTFIKWCTVFDLQQKIIYTEQGTGKNLKLPFKLGYEFAMQQNDIKNCAFFATSDFRAAGILSALDKRGFAPGEYDIISCNNWEDYGFAPFDHPRLTSIDFRREECIRHTVKLLCNAIRSPQNNCIEMTKYPALLKIRESGLML